MRAIIFLPLALAACGTTTMQTSDAATDAPHVMDSGTPVPPEGTGSGSGMFGGQTFSPAGAIFNTPQNETSLMAFSSLFPLATPPVTGNVTTLVIGNEPKTCTAFRTNQSGALQMLIALFDVDEKGNATPPKGPGDYYALAMPGTPWTGKIAMIIVGVCGMGSGYFANIGTISLKTVSPTEISGTFDVTSNLGTNYGSAKGTFTAKPCDAIVNMGTTC
jgi:hypothetical protein